MRYVKRQMPTVHEISALPPGRLYFGENLVFIVSPTSRRFVFRYTSPDSPINQADATDEGAGSCRGAMGLVWGQTGWTRVLVVVAPPTSTLGKWPSLSRKRRAAALHFEPR